jgi:hypothetical protein
VVIRHRDGDLEVPELESELAPSEELLVLPAGHVGKGRHAGIPLRDGVEVVPVLLEILVAAPRPLVPGIHDIELPIDRKAGLPARRQRRGQVDPHHRVDHPVVERLALAGGDLSDLITTAEILPREMVPQFPEPEAGETGRLPRLVPRSVRLEAVLVELEPEVIEGERRVVGVGDHLRAGQPLVLVVKPHRDLVIGALLPVFGPRGPMGTPAIPMAHRH